MEWKNKKVIVTGGAGIIGKELIKKLIEKEAGIKCFDISPKPKIFSEKIEYCQKDLSTLDPKEFSSFDPEIIFHLAATFERTKEEINFWESNFINNTLLSHKVIDTAKDCQNLKKFIFASSYLIYDPSLYLFEKVPEESIKLKEEDRVSPRNLCGAAKYYTEKELEFLNNFKEECPFVSISARIYRVYGRESRDVISRWIRAALKGEQLEVFLEDNTFDYIFSEDVAEGLIRLVESDNAQGSVNLGRGTSYKIKNILNILQEEIPNLKIKRIQKEMPFEASGADMTKFIKLTGWQPKIDPPEGIKYILKYEKEKNHEYSYYQRG